MKRSLLVADPDHPRDAVERAPAELLRRPAQAQHPTDADGGGDEHQHEPADDGDLGERAGLRNGAAREAGHGDDDAAEAEDRLQAMHQCRELPLDHLKGLQPVALAEIEDALRFAGAVVRHRSPLSARGRGFVRRGRTSDELAMAAGREARGGRARKGRRDEQGSATVTAARCRESRTEAKKVSFVRPRRPAARRDARGDAAAPSRSTSRRPRCWSIDMQNDFLHPEGWSAARGMDTSPVRAVIPSIERLTAIVRRADVPVIWVNWGVRADHANLSVLVRRRMRVAIRG